MDENTLNDLLECSVCLERLDISSKVLPCQHTFCRKCLEVIVASRQELKCPECRIEVNTKIDDLPPNVLLMRILEGMKNAAANQHNVNKSPKIVSTQTVPDETHANVESRGPTQNVNQKQNSSRTPPTEQSLNTVSIGQQPKNTANNEPQQQRSHPPVNAANAHHHKQAAIDRGAYIPHAYALYDYTAKEASDLSFKKGDVIYLKRKIDKNWLLGELNGQEGWFPINYAQVIIPLPIPQCMAMYDFKMGPNEEEGCLTFKRGTMIHVLRRVDHNWAEGRIGNCIGIFPIAFVDLNEVAEQVLLESSQLTSQPTTTRSLPPIPLPFDININDSSSNSSTVTTSPNSTCSSNTSSNSVPSSPGSNPTSPQINSNVKYRDYKEKRHSLNALTSGAGLSVIQSNRHSAEILSVPVPTESNQMQSASAQSSNYSRQGRNEAATSSRDATTAPTQSRVNVLKTGGQSNVPPSLPWGYLALYPYKPRKSDELELKKGCVYIVTERCLDGWFKGKNWQDMSGVFPGNYVTPLRARDQQQLMHQWQLVQTNQPISSHIQNSQSTNVNQNASLGSANGNSGNFLENINMRLSQMPGMSHQPPELPPRCVAGGPPTSVSTSSSVWVKPLGHHMESLFGRKSTNLSNHPHQTQQTQNATTIVASQAAKRNHNKDFKEKGTEREKQKEQQPSSTSSAVSLMKRLTNIKRSKSPSANHPTSNHVVNSYSIDNPSFEDHASLPTQPQPPSVVPDCATNVTSALHPVHVRSGSCPSQLLQSLPVELNSGYMPSEVHQSSFGSQRVKGSKERQPLQSLRHQVDGTFRGPNSLLITTPSSATTPSNIMQNKCQQSVPTSATVEQTKQQQNQLHQHQHHQQHQQHHQQNPQSNLIHHRKSQSLDANTISNQLSNNSPSTGVAKGSSAHARES